MTLDPATMDHPIRNHRLKSRSPLSSHCLFISSPAFHQTFERQSPLRKNRTTCRRPATTVTVCTQFDPMGTSPFASQLPDLKDPVSSDKPHVVPDAVVSVASRAADVAGDVIRKFFRRSTTLSVEFKGDDSPVTVADREAEAAIRAVIRATFPTHGIVGEEAGVQLGKKDSSYQWVIDPIDGTKAFMTGRPTFGTLIAVLHDGMPVFGVVDQPITKERWMGGNGRPTTLNGELVKVREYPNDVELSSCTLQATTPEMFVGLDGLAFRSLACKTKQTVYGSDCYAYALLATGCADLVVEADLKVWDFMALVPVVEAAGGVMTDWYGSSLSLHSDGRVIAAAHPKIFVDAIEALAVVDNQMKRELGIETILGEEEKGSGLPADPGEGHIESMTGFGLGIARNEKFSISAQMRSFNSRYCEVQVRSPRALAQFDADFSAIIKKEAARGKISLTLDLRMESKNSHSGQRDLSVVVDVDAAKAARRLLDQVGKAANIIAEPTHTEILSFSEVLVKKDTRDLGSEILPLAKEAVMSAVKNLKSARRQEGAILQLDLMQRTKKIANHLKAIEDRAPDRVEREMGRLKARLREASIDESNLPRLEAELAYYADRVDVTEEIVRLRAHISLFNITFAAADNPIGQRLTFLLQEMNREATTIGSKANDAPIAHLVVLIKEELEKIREQCQNVR